MTIRYKKKGKRLKLYITIHLPVAFFAIFLLALPSVSTAGGLYLNEFGTPSMGVAGAGANAVASDASTSFHNPAGMTRIKSKAKATSCAPRYQTMKPSGWINTANPT